MSQYEISNYCSWTCTVHGAYSVLYNTYVKDANLTASAFVAYYSTLLYYSTLQHRRNLFRELGTQDMRLVNSRNCVYYSLDTFTCDCMCVYIHLVVNNIINTLVIFYIKRFSLL